MDALRTLRACGLLLVATVLLAVLAACDSPGPDGADAAPRAIEVPASGAAPVATAQPTVVVTATLARPVAEALPTATPVATVAAVETRAERPGSNAYADPVPGRRRRVHRLTPTPAETAAPSPIAYSRGFRAANSHAGCDSGADARGALAEELRGIVQKEIRGGVSRVSWELRRSRCT